MFTILKIFILTVPKLIYVWSIKTSTCVLLYQCIWIYGIV